MCHHHRALYSAHLVSGACSIEFLRLFSTCLGLKPVFYVARARALRNSNSLRSMMRVTCSQVRKLLRKADALASDFRFVLWFRSSCGRWNSWWSVDGNICGQHGNIDGGRYAFRKWGLDQRKCNLLVTSMTFRFNCHFLIRLSTIQVYSNFVSIGWCFSRKRYVKHATLNYFNATTQNFFRFQAWSFVVTLIIAKILDFIPFLHLRLSVEQEER